MAAITLYLFMIVTACRSLMMLNNNVSTGTQMMPSMDEMVMTMTATDCVWSFHEAAEAPEADLEG